MENQQHLTHKKLAVDCFNQTWNLLDKRERTSAENEEMIHLCHASFWHWTQVKHHTLQNISIGYWQLSRVYAVVNNGERAMAFAERCVAVSHEAGLAPFFMAYALEAQARAESLLGRVEDSRTSLRRAAKFVQLITDDASRQMVEADLGEVAAAVDVEM